MNIREIYQFFNHQSVDFDCLLYVKRLTAKSCIVIEYIYSFAVILYLDFYDISNSVINKKSMFYDYN